MLSHHNKHQGRVLHDAFVWAHRTPQDRPEYLIEYDARPSDAPPLLPMLQRYVLRSKVRIKDVSKDHDILAAWGFEEHREVERHWNFAQSQSGVIVPDWDAIKAGPNEDHPWPWGHLPRTIRDRRGVGMGERLLVPKDHCRKPTHIGSESSSNVFNVLQPKLRRIMEFRRMLTFSIGYCEAFRRDLQTYRQCRRFQWSQIWI